MRKRAMIWLLAIGYCFHTLVMIPSWSWAEMYVGLYGGPNFATNTDVKIKYPDPLNKSLDPLHQAPVFTYRNVEVQTSAIGGLKLGYWFSKEGTLGFNYPDWMKYFGIELDLSINGLNWPAGQRVLNLQNNPYMRRVIGQNDGYAITFALMFMARYGFFKDAEVPFGRLQPYIGVGPGAFLSTINIFPVVDGNSDSQAICLNVETGVRYFVLKKVSVNLSFKYRYVVPDYHLDENYYYGPRPTRSTYSNAFLDVYPKYNLFNIILGVAYHF